MATKTTVAQPAVRYYVTTLNGYQIEVLHQNEVDFHASLSQKYADQYELTDPSDVADLDRLLMLELQVYRLTAWMMAGLDWDGDVIDQAQIARDTKALKDLHSAIADLKRDLGMTKAQREKAANAGTTAGYIADLRARAKEFGVHREKQLDKALEMFMRLKSIVETFDRSNKREREIMGFETEHDIIEFIRKVVIPDYIEIDKHFQTTKQRYWNI